MDQNVSRRRHEGQLCFVADRSAPLLPEGSSPQGRGARTADNLLGWFQPLLTAFTAPPGG